MAGSSSELDPIPASQPATIKPDANPEIIPLSNIQLITGQRMLESFARAPHFYLQAAVDMTLALELLDQVRQQIESEIGERITLTVLLVKAVSAAIKKNPRVNTVFEKDHLRASPPALRGSLQINIGVAIGSEEGLVVPVIKNVGDKSLAEITQELKTYQVKAREMRFSAEDLSKGTFTISNLGMYGVDVFQAIINPPQSCILAVGRVIKTPVGLSDDRIALRPMMNMTLSADHRVLDGIQAAKFLVDIKSYLETPGLLL
jgi:pyruvate dehydrogenase E2 component (dihydrolipoamide acetyltransferase)